MLLKIIRNLIKNFTKSIIKFNQPYWVEITTREPGCIYYFGPFDSHNEAQKMQHGYLEDLIEEKAKGISIKIKRCLPTKLTIVEEE